MAGAHSGACGQSHRRNRMAPKYAPPTDRACGVGCHRAGHACVGRARRHGRRRARHAPSRRRHRTSARGWHVGGSAGRLRVAVVGRAGPHAGFGTNAQPCLQRLRDHRHVHRGDVDRHGRRQLRAYRRPNLRCALHHAVWMVAAWQAHAVCVDARAGGRQSLSAEPGACGRPPHGRFHGRSEALHRSLQAETCLAMLILVLVAWLGLLSPVPA